MSEAAGPESRGAETLSSEAGTESAIMLVSIGLSDMMKVDKATQGSQSKMGRREGAARDPFSHW